ncbi:Ribosomal large subunit pseudouridine synthase D [Salinispira pacifica]|uniref:Ribosomal large subunit pseudouridine synthase D n=1 Tax=Salinispira pacifica TaxID=1307761 RepID=V5WEM1_9SPIO|nr:Ribosomal large subunit pseudouridine synthase D [Salinispira pacifica]
MLEQLAGSYPEVLPVKENSGDAPADHSRWREGYLLHRLDNWTSGVLLFARNQEAFETFRSLIRGSAGKSAVEKEYLACVEGRIPGSLPVSIEYPMAHSSKRSSGKMVAVKNSPEEEISGSFPWREKYRGNPRAAKTRILSCSVSRDGGSICRIMISRGQRHQIRCHLAAIGCPIQGDTLYGAAPLKQKEGFLLQHQKIRFFHPFLQKEIIIEAPMPEWVRKARF